MTTQSPQPKPANDDAKRKPQADANDAANQPGAETAATRGEQKQIDNEDHATARDKLSDKLND